MPHQYIIARLLTWGPRARVTFKAARFGSKLPAAPRRFAVHAAFERPAFPPGPSVPTKPRMVCGSELKKGHIMSSKKPTLIAHTVKERGDGQKAIWTRIGAAWRHGSGTSSGNRAAATRGAARWPARRQAVSGPQRPRCQTDRRRALPPRIPMRRACNPPVDGGSAHASRRRARTYQ
jgi:hypothetical protein